MEKIITKTLAFDLGKTTGWAVGFEDGIYAKGSFTLDSFNQLFKEVKRLIDLYKPDVVINCQGFTQSRKIARVYGAREGIVALACERSEIPYISESDKFIRKCYFDRGNMRKEEVCDHFDMEHSEHDIADAMVAALYLFK